jgi:hypothetical protein
VAGILATDSQMLERNVVETCVSQNAMRVVSKLVVVRDRNARGYHAEAKIQY